MKIDGCTEVRLTATASSAKLPSEVTHEQGCLSPVNNHQDMGCLIGDRFVGFGRSREQRILIYFRSKLIQDIVFLVGIQ